MNTKVKCYKVVGWYSHNPHNEQVVPFARVVYVETDDPTMASQLGADALYALYVRENASVDLLNWYTEVDK